MGRFGVLETNRLANEFIECFENFNTERMLNRLKLNFKGENVILYLLMEAGGRSTPGKMSKKVDFTAARISAIIKSLENKGYVEKIQNSDDKRSNIVAITTQGFMYYMLLRQQLVQKVMAITEQLGERDVMELIRIINRISVISDSMEEQISDKA